MGDYLTGVVVAVGITALASLFAPAGKMHRPVRFVFSVIAFLIISLPVVQAVSDGSMDLSVTLPDEEPIQTDVPVYDLAQQELERLVSDRFRIDPGDVDVSIVVEKGEGADRISTIFVYIKGSCSTAEIENYVKGLTTGDCEVRVLAG